MFFLSSPVVFDHPGALVQVGGSVIQVGLEVLLNDGEKAAIIIILLIL